MIDCHQPLTQPEASALYHYALGQLSRLARERYDLTIRDLSVDHASLAQQLPDTLCDFLASLGEIEAQEHLYGQLLTLAAEAAQRNMSATADQEADHV